MTMSLDESICAYFVNNLKSSDSNEPDTLEQFTTALELMGQQLAETQIRQIKPSEGYPLIAAGNLTKKDVFVLAQFDGDFFQQLQMTKALILGPPCLVSCLRHNEPIPLGSSAIYTTAMRDLLVSATGITPQKKEELSKLIKWMGGVYFQSFGHRTTHLISNTIKSNKYEQATLNGVPVMHVDWVQYVWDQSRKRQKESIRAIDPDFDKYRLPTFFGANITCSGLDVARKDQVMRLVNDNGGIYHRAFRSQVVDIVITEQSKTDTEKYKAAIRFKKDVLLPEWIFDSHSRGYALPTKNYEVRAGKKVSTPTKSSSSRHSAACTGPGDQTQLSDLSRISFVSGSRRMCSDMTTVNETLSSLAASSPAKDLLKQATTSSSGSSRNYQQVLAEICPRQAKKAGPLLDGCCVYLSGFRTEEREKLNRVLNTCGATRYDEANEGISHIIVGQLDDTEYRQWERDGLMGTVHVVRLDWLLESIRFGRLVNEVVHRVSLPQTREPDVASPASKRTLRSMNHSFKQPQLPIKKKLFEGEPEPEEEKPQDMDVELLNQYSQDQEPVAQLPPTAAANPEVSMLLNPAASSTQMEVRPALAAPLSRRLSAVAGALPLPDLSASTLSIDFDKLDYFTGVSVYVHKDSFNTEFYTQMLSECEAAQGLLVPASFSDEVDYAIVSFEVTFEPDSLPIRARHVVTELFLESCMKQNKLLPAEYYHLPVPSAASREPLTGMTIVVSIYAGLERDFINSVATLLGASVNKTFIKKEKPLLVCPTAEGSKYEGAIKWHYPVVTSAWLVQCAQAGEKLPYVDHLVGKSQADFPLISPRLKESNLRTPRRQGSETDQQQQSAMSSVAREEAENQPEAIPVPVTAPPPVVPVGPAPELTPLRNRRVSELAGVRRGSSSGSPSPPDSPRTPINQVYSQGYNFDFLEEFVERLDTDEGKECVRQIIREMRENQTPELERIRRQACTPVSHQNRRPAPGIPEFCLTPEFKQRMADDFERRWRLPTQAIQPDTPISVIRKRVMRITCETLGIDYDDDVEEDHPPPIQKNQKLNFDRRSPKTPKATTKPKPPSPAKKTPPRVSVSLLSGSASGSPFVPSTQSPGGVGAAESTINFDKISFEETTTAGAAATAIEPLNRHNSPDVKQITDYLKNCESRRNSLKRNHDSHLESAESEVQFVQPFESEGFALGTEDMVDWRDPAEFNAAKRRSSGSPRMQHAGTPCFSISCGDDDEKRAELIDRIQQLGGKLCDNLVNYDDACTHLLCERPNRGEKMLACIAAGKWVLNIQYIEQCHARGHFLDEAQHEWGNPRALNLPTLAPEEDVIAVAAHRWRTELSVSGGGAYSEHRVILSLHERSGAAIRNVLRAGGACILEPRSPFAQDPLVATATDCFVDIKKAPLAPRDLAHLQHCGVRIFTQLAINYYLMHGREANLEKYVVK
ncbi:DNA topoisomerase 2-binding protein 1-A [Drosophila pseudoobscura]|uniref:DNA topoisomerase 2-binding protein 1-A n=1 Tax=Drosophila pseudoobscura pseudoobscura TaxID=46245 RepID=A0A6I8UFD1_DROPS|nr:DNA topoisomerase 2-binding protein 1-A [Drosophila pseudoobscura]